ncbi:MAG: carboxypeptidase M32, partial [Rhodobacteraceae bacterium]|nr:carboxypeptidase M32 [Paracoccaceae bacterium]
MTAFARLMAFQRETEALAGIAGRLEWDRDTVMPPGAAAQRAEEIAALEAVLHARRTDPRLGEWLAAARPGDAAGARALFLIGREHARATRVPPRLAAEIARRTSLAQGVWAAARAGDDVAAFLPTLAAVIALKREEAAALAAGATGADAAYDALLDDHEAGATAAGIAALFAELRPGLVALRDHVLGATPPPPPLSGHFPAADQLALAREVAGRFGYDFARGRIDLAVHPFASGSGADVRITTRIDEADPFICLFAVIHETGHAAYEQTIAPAHTLTPLGRGVSKGVHESQSRIYENQIGRSRGFCRWLHRAMRAAFGERVPADPDAFHAAANRVVPGFIRTAADEVHYNLHILLRFDLERELIAGRLAAGDLEAAWNDRFEADFGVAVTRPSEGMLQDVHWAAGLFGYFPTYTLGNLYAACLWQALVADIPAAEALMERGELAPITGWLGERLQRPGGLHPPRETVARACGFAPSARPLLDYLQAKFGA